MKKRQENIIALFEKLLTLNDQEALDEIKLFKAKQTGIMEDPEFGPFLLHKEAMYYSQNKSYDKALKIYNSLLEDDLQAENPNVYSIGVTYLSIIKVLLEMDKYSEVSQLAEKIMLEYNFDWGLSLNFLYDLISADGNADLLKYENKIKEIEDNLMIDIEVPLNLKERILFLKQENRRANLAFSKIILDSPKELLKEKLEKYIAEEKVGFFRLQAENYINYINSIKKT